MSIFLHGKYLPNNSDTINMFCGSMWFGFLKKDLLLIFLEWPPQIVQYIEAVF